MDVREDEEHRGKPAKDLSPIPLELGEPDKVTYIGASLVEPPKGMLVTFLQGNNEVFAWTEVDMPGIDPQLITHKLNLDPGQKIMK